MAGPPWLLKLKNWRFFSHVEKHFGDRIFFSTHQFLAGPLKKKILFRKCFLTCEINPQFLSFSKYHLICEAMIYWNSKEKKEKNVMLCILKILSWLPDRVVENVEACSEKEGLMLKLFQRRRRCDALPRLRRQLLHAIRSYKKHFFDFLGKS